MIITKEEADKHFMGYFFDQKQFQKGKLESNYMFCKN